MLKLYNTLHRKVEQFQPLNPPNVNIYSCGPTVYDYQHIGHMRRYVGDDILIRVLKLNKYIVKHIMNITDVGHLVSDSDEGEDKMEKGARKFGKNVWDIAEMFERQFIESCTQLNISLPEKLLHATGYIKEQIELIKILEKRGFTYKISDGIYFDTSKFPSYFNLSRQNPEELKKGARVDFVEGKKNVSDFALWKFDPNKKKTERGMNWWLEGEYSGEVVLKRSASDIDLEEAMARLSNSSSEERKTIGFPGWHIECSAMSMQGLFNVFANGKLNQDKVQTIDIHTGGIDHINIHHTNEIAQTEAATGKKFVNFWVHHNFLEVNREKMSKSQGNFYTVQDIIKKGYNPMSLRYLYLQTHYRQEMNFTWEALDAAEKAYNKLQQEILNYIQISDQEELLIGCAEFEQRFLDSMNDDLNTPKALAIVWELTKSAYPVTAKIASLKKFDAVLGMNLFAKKNIEIIPEKIKELVSKREYLRKSGNFDEADLIRKEIKSMGYDINDTLEGPELIKIHKHD